MTNFINSPISTAKVSENTDLFLKTANLIKTVSYYQKKMEQSRYRLMIIKNAKEGSRVGKKAEKFLQRQHKLIEIADELQRRMIAQVGSGNMPEAVENQFIQEVDLLNWMHFEVTKSYTSFIHENFEARVISLLRPIAA